MIATSAMKSMATSTIQALSGRFVVRYVTTESKEIGTNSNTDYYIPISDFNSPGTYLGIVSYRYFGTGVSNITPYYVFIDISPTNEYAPRVRAGVRNRDSQARTMTLTVGMLFLE